MRKCEKCDGPGPALWEDGPVQDHGRYLCVRCHSKPQDPFFTPEDRLPRTRKVVDQMRRDGVPEDKIQSWLVEAIKKVSASYGKKDA